MPNITAIRQVTNDTSRTVSILNIEKSEDTDFPAGATFPGDVWIPWCTSQVDFDHNHYLILRVRDPLRDYYIWQSDEGGWDAVRYNTEQRWTPRALAVEGASNTSGDRRVEVRADGSFVFHVT